MTTKDKTKYSNDGTAGGFFVLKNENVEGVLKPPFFKDMAVSNA